jgi:hypothetical protein
MMFWIQARDELVKEDLRVTILLKSGSCTATVYQGEYPATADCVASPATACDIATKKITVIEPNNSGRYIGIKLTGSDFVLAGINVEPKVVNEYERKTR